MCKSHTHLAHHGKLIFIKDSLAKKVGSHWLNLKRFVLYYSKKTKNYKTKQKLYST